MKLIFRLFIVMILFGGIALLAGQVAWAGGSAQVVSQTGTASLSGLVWNDKNQDGLQEIGESGIPNVSVELFDGKKALVTMALTDKAGQYRFEGLTPGEYYVHFIVPTGFAVSTINQGQNEAIDSDAEPSSANTVPVTLASGENSQQWDAGLYTSAALLAQVNPGTVKPPPGDVTICQNGVHSVGGVSTLTVTNLKQGYCIVASVKKNMAVGRIPDGVGGFLADVTFLRVFYNGKLVSELPSADGQSQICYAAPPGKTVQIYFLDFYGPRFGRPEQRNWVPILETTISGGLACAPAQSSGAYALIGQ